jgi:hypothetical protein
LQHFRVQKTKVDVDYLWDKVETFVPQPFRNASKKVDQRKRKRDWTIDKEAEFEYAACLPAVAPLGVRRMQK